MLTYQTIEELCRAAEQAGGTISQAVLSDQAQQLGVEEGAVYGQMAARLQIMRESVEAGSNPDLRSSSGLSGGDAAKMLAYAQTGGITGPFLNQAIARALATSECNAAMGKIVAAPTAGSCGILPGTVLSVLEAGQCDEKQAVMALFTAGGIGTVISSRATLAGAEGGCQAECGAGGPQGGPPPGGVNGGNARSGLPRLRHSVKKPAGPGVRPGGRLGGSTLYQAECGRHYDCPVRRRDGPSGH